MSKVVYEVTLKLKSHQIRSQFARWLHQHIKDMLEINGFEAAELLDNSDQPLHFTVQYWVTSMGHLENYFNNEAAAMRADGMERFPRQFTASRRILTVNQHYTARRHFMDLNLDRILKELSKFGNINKIRTEIRNITKELKTLQRAGTEQAKETIKQLEKRYSELLSQFNRVQKQLDDEVHKAVNTIEKTRSDVEKALNVYKKKATDHKDKLSGAFKKKKAKKAAAKAAKTTKKAVKKKTTAKAATKKTTKKTTKKVAAAKKTTKKASKAKTAKKTTAKKVKKAASKKKTTRKTSR